MKNKTDKNAVTDSRKVASVLPKCPKFTKKVIRDVNDGWQKDEYYDPETGKLVFWHSNKVI